MTQESEIMQKVPPLVVGKESMYMHVRCEEEEYTVYYDSKQRGLTPMCTIKGLDGFLKVWDDGEIMQILNVDERQLQPCEKSGIITVQATSYREAREEAQQILNNL